MTLKLANWRTRSYPIRIMVDDKPVYSGETPRSLGYVTLTFPPVTGRSLKIELAGRPIDVDAFGQIIEVTGKKDTEAAAKKDKGTLSIVEIEIYGPSQNDKNPSIISSFASLSFLFWVMVATSGGEALPHRYALTQPSPKARGIVCTTRARSARRATARRSTRRQSIERSTRRQPLAGER